MTTPNRPARSSCRGTEQPDVVGRTLTAGPLSVELDNGQLRYLKLDGIEVLRAVAFLVRDENWGTYVPSISNLKVEQRPDGFSVSYRAVCSKGSQEIAFEASIEGRADGSLEFTGSATPKTDFLTARTGFVVLHPLKGVVGKEVEVEHVDGTIAKSKFPEHVNPVQPFLHIRALTHAVMPGVKATVRFEGDTWEMEDHRNWTDASFKTYVRPLALPWPYTLKAGETITQAVKVSLSGKTPDAGASAAKGVAIELGAATRANMPPIGLGMPAEEIEYAVMHLDLLKLAAPRFLQCQFDPRARHGLKELYGYRVLCEQTGAQCVLEIVVESLNDYADELARLASMVKQSGLNLAAIAVCPVGDLKVGASRRSTPAGTSIGRLVRRRSRRFPGGAPGRRHVLLLHRAQPQTSASG